MADPFDRNTANVPGRLFVDTTCIDCDLCRSIAPQFLTRSDELAITYAHAQPVTEEDFALAQEAVASCPTDSVGLE